MFAYINHVTGEFSFSHKRVEYEDLYCYECEDYDDYVGEVKNQEELKKLVKRVEKEHCLKYSKLQLGEIYMEFERAIERGE